MFILTLKHKNVLLTFTFEHFLKVKHVLSASLVPAHVTKTGFKQVSRTLHPSATGQTNRPTSNSHCQLSQDVDMPESVSKPLQNCMNIFSQLFQEDRMSGGVQRDI